jgi:hypothetical protein
VHLDNTCPYNSKISDEHLEEFSARRMQHPVYIPDPAPRDFFLFGTLKTKLQNYEIHSRDDLISAIWNIFDEILKETPNSVFDS